MSAKSVRSRRGELTIAVAMGLFGLYLVLAALQIRYETGLFGGVIGAMLLTFSLINAVRILQSPPAGDRPAEAIPWRGAAWAATFVAIVVLLGFEIASLVWPAALLIAGRAKPLAMVAIPVCLYLLLRLVMIEGLDVKLFEGVLFGATLPRFF